MRPLPQARPDRVTGFGVAAELGRLHDEHGDTFVARISAGTACPIGAALLVDCEVLVPAALQDVVDDDVAHRLKASLVVEGANLPTTPSAQRILADRGITVVPDFVANAGGVIAAAFATDTRYSGFRADIDQVFATISDKLRSNASTVSRGRPPRRDHSARGRPPAGPEAGPGRDAEQEAPPAAVTARSARGLSTSRPHDTRPNRRSHT